MARDGFWRDSALCAQVDPDLFFPVSAKEKTVGLAKAICARCPVRPECEAVAKRQGERWGIWAGRLRGVESESDAGTRKPAHSTAVASGALRGRGHWRTVSQGY